jgi:putative PIN family toxin of toxin-antitoxin system
MRLVLDTNVVVSALLWKGAPRRLLRAVAEAGVELCTSRPLLAELAVVLSRSKFKKKISDLGFSPEQLFDSYAKCAEVVQAALVPRLAPDPDDDVVIGTALAAKADFLITGDRALLSIATYESVRIISVREALDAIARGFPHEDH